MEMKKRYGRLFSLIVLLAVAAVFSGCGKKEKVTAESLMEEVSANMEDVQSARMNLLAEISMGIKQSGISMDMDIDLDMDLETTNDPVAAHIDADMSMSLMGLSMEMENYTVEENGKLVTYNGVAGEWTRTEEPLDKDRSESVNAMIANGTSYELQDKTEKLNGQEVYVLNGKVSGRYMEGMIGEVPDAMGGLTVDWSKLVMDIVVKIDKETKRPVEARIDCGDTLEELMKSAMASAGVGEAEISIKEFIMTCTYESFNDVEEIVVPEDVKAAARSAGSSAGGSGSLDEFLNNSQPESDLPSVSPENLEAEGILKPNADGTYTLMNFWGNGDSVNIAVPAGYEFSAYSDDTYLAFNDTFDRDFDDVSISYMLDDDYTEEEMIDYYMEDIDLYQESADYSDIEVEGPNRIEVNGRNVSYVKFSYVYDKDLYYVEYHAWTFLPNGQVVQCDVTEGSYNGACEILDDSIVETVMSAIQGQASA